MEWTNILLRALCVILFSAGVASVIMGTLAFRDGLSKGLRNLDIRWPDLGKWMDRCWEAGERLGRWIVRKLCD